MNAQSIRLNTTASNLPMLRASAHVQEQTYPRQTASFANSATRCIGDGSCPQGLGQTKGDRESQAPLVQGIQPVTPDGR